MIGGIPVGSPYARKGPSRLLEVLSVWNPKPDPKPLRKRIGPVRAGTVASLRSSVRRCGSILPPKRRPYNLRLRLPPEHILVIAESVAPLE
jgi:hypothetical protein